MTYLLEWVLRGMPLELHDTRRDGLTEYLEEVVDEVIAQKAVREIDAIP
jgi:hypothetical protein